MVLKRNSVGVLCARCAPLHYVDASTVLPSGVDTCIKCPDNFLLTVGIIAGVGVGMLLLAVLLLFIL